MGSDVTTSTPGTDRAARAGGVVVWIAAAALALATGRIWLTAVTQQAVGYDAGFYVLCARMVAAGLVPFRDFANGYPPLAYYALSLLGDEGLRSIATVRSFTYTLQLANVLLLALALRSIGATGGVCALLAVTYWAWCAVAEGLYLGLEVFQCFWLLAALGVLLRRASPAAAGMAGLLAGASLMSKQYSLAFVPPLVLLAWAGDGRASRAGWVAAGGPLRAACCLAALPLPFLGWALTAGVHLDDAFANVASFGGGALQYERAGFANAAAFLATEPAARLLPPALALTVWAVARERSPRSAAFALGITLAACTLSVRTYEHYLQLAMPWATLGVGLLIVQLGARRQAAVAIVLLVVPLLTLIDELRAVHRPIAGQVIAVRQLGEIIPPGSRVFTPDSWWLYALMDVQAPAGGTASTATGRATVANADYAVVRERHRAEWEDWLARQDLRPVRVLEWPRKLRVYAR